MTDVDVAVVGGGPAGLAAAVAAAEAGASVALIDSGATTGGQYWRNTPGVAAAHHAWRRYRALIARLDASTVRVLTEHQVTMVRRTDEGFVLPCVHPVEPRSSRAGTVVTARRLVLATGAYDRQLPFPGWDLPGVLAAGGVQALLKQHGVLAGRRVVVAGTGPFLVSVAAQLLAAGADVPVVVEANAPAGFARHPRAVAGTVGKIGEAAGYTARLARHRTKYLTRQAVVRVVGDDAVTGVEVARLHRDGTVRSDGATRHVDCDVLAVGWGFVAQLELQLQLGCAVDCGDDGGLAVTVDDQQQTTVPDVWAAGEATGIGGADLAVAEGAIAGRAAAGMAPLPDEVRRRARLRRFARALHAVHPIPNFLVDDLPDPTVVCRCEEVTAGAIRRSVDELGATDARTVKLLTRAGMGWCQGRVCAGATVNLTARLLRRSPTVSDLGSLAARPLTTPLRLGELTSRENGPRMVPSDGENASADDM